MKKNTNHERSRIDFDKYAIAAETCACSNFRRASRALTQMFDHALQPAGLRSTQLIILLEIAVARYATASELARRLVMDPSTLARNLKLITKQGWIRNKASGSGRGQEISLTARGIKAVEKAVPLWEQAQTTFARQLGEKRWRTLQSDLSAAVSVARGSAPLLTGRP
jgi:DNA-binding MarR family transcriptional regulator